MVDLSGCFDYLVKPLAPSRVKTHLSAEFACAEFVVLIDHVYHDRAVSDSAQHLIYIVDELV